MAGVLAAVLGCGGVAAAPFGRVAGAAAAESEPVIDCGADARIFASGYDGNGGALPNGALDPYWTVSGGTSDGVDANGTDYVQDDGFYSGPDPNFTIPDGIVGPVQLPPADAVFHPAEVGKVASTWGTPTPGNGGNWISHNYPAGKLRVDGTPYPAKVNSNNASYGDWYYKFDFRLAAGVDPSKVAFDVRFFADNSVAQIWMNGNPVAPAGTRFQGGANPYRNANYANTAAGTTPVLLTGHWQSGENTLILQLKSTPGAEGLGIFMASRAVCTTPTANDDTSVAAQGATQTIDVLANDTPGSDPVNPIDPSTLTLLGADGAPTIAMTIPGQGSYTLAGGKVVFTPEPGFTGVATPATYRVSNVHGDAVTAVVTPTVTPVATPDTTSGPQGQPQASDVLANDGTDGNSLDPSTLTLIGQDGSRTDTVTVPGEGSYTVADGTVVFTPEPDFIGTATPVSYQAADSRGDVVQSTYTPTTTPVPVASPDTSTGPQGHPQTVDVLADDGANGDPLDPSTLTLIGSDGNPTDTVTAPGEGVYTVQDGKIVFTPEPAFVGVATPVTYRVADVTGNVAMSTLTPTVTASPVVPPPATPPSEAAPPVASGSVPLSSVGPAGAALPSEGRAPDPTGGAVVDTGGYAIVSGPVPAQLWLAGLGGVLALALVLIVFGLRLGVGLRGPRGGR